MRLLWNYFIAFLTKNVIIDTSCLQVKGKENMHFKRLVKELRTKLILTQEELSICSKKIILNWRKNNVTL